jgi:hypothetical protein
MLLLKTQKIVNKNDRNLLLKIVKKNYKFVVILEILFRKFHIFGKYILKVLVNIDEMII